MNRTQKTLLVIASLLLLVAVQLGALGAHAFNDRFTPQQISNWQLAVQYQMVHALGIMLACWLIGKFPTAAIFSLAAWIMLLGILLFCGSIYISSFVGKGFISALAPYGGISMMIAWLLIATGVFKQ
ncbi:MAG: DUF423 domain-containing protein [Gammaproteobacteria bacterium]|nr:DUF423 domain-containing protein [Gammaproteobacteria bacterium]NND53410.1 DUF423 domain-containing protein [Gammaproteobacteria bacterium]